jgi:hypothetical protein
MKVHVFIRYVDNLCWSRNVPYPLAANHYTVKAVAKVDDNEKIVSYFSRNSTPATAIYGSLEYLSKQYGFQCSYNMKFDEYKDSDGLKITITRHSSHLLPSSRINFLKPFPQ